MAVANKDLIHALLIYLDPHFSFIRNLPNKYRFNLSSEAKGLLDDYHDNSREILNYKSYKPVKNKFFVNEKLPLLVCRFDDGPLLLRFIWSWTI